MIVAIDGLSLNILNACRIIKYVVSITRIEAVVVCYANFFWNVERRLLCLYATIKCLKSYTYIFFCTSNVSITLNLLVQQCFEFNFNVVFFFVLHIKDYFFLPFYETRFCINESHYRSCKPVYQLLITNKQLLHRGGYVTYIQWLAKHTPCLDTFECYCVFFHYHHLLIW